MHEVQLFVKPTDIYRFVIQRNSQSSNPAKHIVTVTHVFTFTELRWGNKIYGMFQFALRYVKWSSLATSGGVTDLN